jgi:hypothetical protein
VVLLLALAFFLGSAPIRNSDVWLHLATGHALVAGSWRFGPDPFSYAGGETWVVHSWLFDLLSYEMFAGLGGAGLAAARGLLTAALAFVLVRLGTRGPGLGLATACAALAVLAVAARLPFQPVCVSYLFLALTLLLLQRAARLRTAEPAAGWLRAYGPLLLLFILWVNLDNWFLLGPATVALYLLGQALGGRRRATDLAGLALLLPAGLAACLVNPWHLRAFIPPSDVGLSGAAAVLRHDPGFAVLFASPFQWEYLTSGLALTPVGVAFYLLAVLSLVSFALGRQGLRSWRLTTWLGFFVLAAWNARSVPFFAVVAGPILALNLHDFFQRRRALAPESAWRPRALAGRQAALLALVALVVVAWPGWLQGPPYERRSWALVQDPSVQRVAEEVARWRRDGHLAPGSRGFTFSIEAANSFAWFCPTEPGWLDASLQAPAEAAADFVAVRRALLGQPGKAPDADWRARLRSRHVDHLILYDNDHERLLAVYQRLLQSPAEWPLLLIDGHTLVFGWRDPEKGGNAFAGLRFDPGRLAYHPPEDKRAPSEGPGPEARPPEWWDAFVTPRRPPSPDRDEAALHLIHFSLYEQPYRQHGLAVWVNGLAAASAGTGAAGTLGAGLWQAMDAGFLHVALAGARQGPDGQPFPLDATGLRVVDNHLFQGDDGPPALLLLGIRAARRAIRDSPHDPHAYLVLGELYLRLAHNTRDRLWQLQFPYLARLREVQAATALHQALRLQPDLIQAHASLVSLYHARGYKDLALDHLRDVLRLSRQRGPLAGEDAEQTAQRLDGIVQRVRRLQQEVGSLRDMHDVSAANMKVQQRAQHALERGLPGVALDTLLAQSDIAAATGKAGTQMELELLLIAGRLQDVRDWLVPPYKDLLGGDNYHWIRALCAAGSGDYVQADEDLVASVATDAPSPDKASVPTGRAGMAMMIGQAILERRLDNESITRNMYAPVSMVDFHHRLTRLVLALRQEANTTVLRGLLALESGQTARAAEHFRAALAVWKSDAAAADGGGLDFGGRQAAQYLLELLSAKE